MMFPRKTIFHFVLLSFVFVLSTTVVWSQGCPTILIETPPNVAQPGDKFELSALVKGSVGLSNLKFHWTLSSGTIEKGQGSSVISVSTTKENAGTNIHAKVDISGLSPVCENSASEVFGIAGVPCVYPVDDFGAIKANDVKARIDNLFVQLSFSPNTIALLEMEFAENEPLQQRRLRIENILAAISFRKYDLKKVVFLISNEKTSTVTRIRVAPLETDMAPWINRGTVVSGTDMKQKLPTLFQDK